MTVEGPPRLILARHGETEYNRRLLCQGWLDEPLNDTGREQACSLAGRLGPDPVARVVASPLKRARATAEEIANRFGLPVEVHDGLREINHGSLEGKPFMELDDFVPGIREAWRMRPHTVQMPDGETLADLQERAWPVFESVTNEHLYAMRNGGPYGRLVIVAHAVAIATLMCRLREEPLSRMTAHRLGPCGYFELEHDGDVWNTVQAVDLMDSNPKA